METGSWIGQFQSRNGVAIWANGHVYVADSGNARVPEFVVDLPAKTATHVATIGAKGTAPGQFAQLTGVAVSQQGCLYVADRIQRLATT